MPAILRQHVHAGSLTSGEKPYLFKTAQFYKKIGGRVFKIARSSGFKTAHLGCVLIKSPWVRAA
jgi:hypothetical protein